MFAQEVRRDYAKCCHEATLYIAENALCDPFKISTAEKGTMLKYRPILSYWNHISQYRWEGNARQSLRSLLLTLDKSSIAAQNAGRSHQSLRRTLDAFNFSHGRIHSSCTKNYAHWAPIVKLCKGTYRKNCQRLAPNCKSQSFGATGTQRSNFTSSVRPTLLQQRRMQKTLQKLL